MNQNTNPAGNPVIREAGRVSRPASSHGRRPEEFRSFEALTRKLVGVPKRELDEKRKG